MNSSSLYSRIRSAMKCAIISLWQDIMDYWPVLQLNLILFLGYHIVKVL